MAASQLSSSHRSHCDHHSARELRHISLVTDHSASELRFNSQLFPEGGITTRIEASIVSRNVPNSCANLESRIVPQEQPDHFSVAYQALPCSPPDQRLRSQEGETYPASPLSSSMLPGSFQLSCLSSRPPGRKSNEYNVQLFSYNSTHFFKFFLGSWCKRMRRGGQVVLIGSPSLKTPFPPAATLKVLHSKSEREIW